MSETGIDAARAARGAAYVVAGVITLLLAWLALRANDHMSAFGLALVTLAALLASPQLLDRLLVSAAAVRLLRQLAVLGLVIAAASIGLAIALQAPPRTARALGAGAAVAVVVSIYAGLTALTPWLARWSVGERDLMALADWLETDERVWLAAGVAFLAGTALQFAAA
jgi:hypothetical protein